MNVAILFSGGKDSTYAVEYAKEKNWNIQYLLSVKPTRKDCYLFHYATVEHTHLQADSLGLRHFLINCDVADPEQEANIIKKYVWDKQNEFPIDAILLGGTGLQMTQLKSLQQALRVLNVEVFAAHAGLDHEELFKDMINKGYEIMVTQVASDGLAHWLGEKITKENYPALEKDSQKYGFHVGFEGGYADTFVCNAPSFKKRIIVEQFEKKMDDQYSGHVLFKTIGIQKKTLVHK
jgi:diphthine-ammonia ligase